MSKNIVKGTPKGVTLPKLWSMYCACEADRQVLERNYNILRDEVRGGYQEYQNFILQLNYDLATIVLSDEFGFTVDDIKKFNRCLSEMWSKYADVWNGDTGDMEYSYDDLDRALAASVGAENVLPYEKRYEGYMFKNRKEVP